MAKVYVSSTIADLRRERRAVLGWLLAARHQAVDSYLPDSEKVRDSCLGDVDTCDLYVLILGHRYGFCPAEANPEGLSITHLEFRRAGDNGIPRIALLRTSIPDVSLSDIEDPQKAQPVLAFRAEVNDAVRAAEFRDLQGLIQGLSTGVLSELEKADSPWAVGRVQRLSPQPPLLAGREELLAGLDVRLAGGGGSGPQVVALCGLAGKGKTSVAVEYAHRHLAEAGITWQFAAEDPAVLAAGFGELAAQLGARDVAGDAVAWVHGALAAYPAGWLLIFDHAPGPGPVQRFLPSGGAGRVLITSRNALWPPGQAIEVPVLDTGVAAEFLVERTGDPDTQTATELARELGGLPLALEQAAADTQATGDTLAGYLASFRKRRASLLALGEPTGYDKTVAATWALAFTQLEDSDPGAVGLLRLLAFCAPEAVPVRLLLRPRPGLAEQLAADVASVLVSLLEDEQAAGDAIAALRRYSLVRPAGDGLVSVHRLVQAVTLEQMTEELSGAWRQATATVVEAAIPEDPQQPGTWPVFATLLPHAQAALAADSNGMERVAAYLGYSGNHVAARELYRGLLENRVRALGPEHPATLLARAEVAFFTGAAGDAAGARDQLAALLPLRERVLGPEHPSALITRANLARWTGLAGHAAGARDQFAALLPVYEQVLGPEHPDTLTVRANLASFTGEVGEVAGARDQFAALLPVYERVLGPSTRTPWPSAPTFPPSPGRQGMWPGPVTCTPRCCPWRSGSSAASTRPPWPTAPTLPPSPGRRGMRPGPVTSSPRCCPYMSGSSVPSTRPL